MVFKHSTYTISLNTDKSWYFPSNSIENIQSQTDYWLIPCQGAMKQQLVHKFGPSNSMQRAVLLFLTINKLSQLKYYYTVK